MEIIMKKICNIEQCTGCFACYNICPKHAISIAETSLGKTIPSIDEAQCIDCGACTRVCPQNNQSTFRSIQACYAAQTKQPSDREVSASGGIAAGFYRFFLSLENSVVYGAKFDPDLTLRQIACTNTKDFEAFRTSKYTQSFVGTTYSEVKNNLREGKHVLYIGTPCQIDGLLHFLGESPQNLLTIDLICHGVPPVRYLKEYAKHICRDQNVNYATFRGKDDYILCFFHDDKKLYKKRRELDYYFNAFLEGVICRDNCSTCAYARPERISDITIGDFWGLHRETLQQDLKGRISTILVNTSKGADYLAQCKDLFLLEPREIEEAIQGNSQLKAPQPAGKDAQTFRNLYPKKGFYGAIKKTSTAYKVVYRRSVLYRMFCSLRDRMRRH